MMKKFGLIGEKLSHSFSPQLHKMLGGYDYGLYELAPNELDGFMRAAEFDGVNVTIPYKKAVVPYCAELSPAAAKTGSVNTVVRRADGSLYGDNTDLYGFEAMLKKHKIPVGKKALVLGSGGVSRPIVAALRSLGAEEVVNVSRSGEDNYENLSRHYDAELIVNATPVGMFPHNGESLVALERFPKLRGVADVVYNPLRTKLVSDAEALGIRACGGLYMLAAQAARSSELFTDKTISDEKLDAVYAALMASVRNIVLIGMPGCGKSTTAAALGALTGRKVTDCDEEIIRRAGMRIPEYFEKYGVESFRELESEVLRDITRQSGGIIATGGGVVMREKNYAALHQNGVIVYLERELEGLPTEGRPLSQAGLRELAELRLPIYKRWCDKKIRADSEREAAAMIKELYGL